MRPSLLPGQGALYQHGTGPLVLKQTSPALGRDLGHTPLPLLWCGLRLFVDHLAAWASPCDSIRLLFSLLSAYLSLALQE